MTILVQQLRAEIERLQAENAALEKRLCICQECGGRGEVHTGEYSYEGEWQPPEPVMVECGECGGDGQIGGIQDLDAVIIERDQLKVENARWQKNYEHLIEQHMPRTGHGCEEGWSRVVEARELQAENAELRRDAERYRWLRESKNTEGPSMVSVYATGELDSAIDRMIAKE